jgi:hypothetical protein
MFSNLTVDLYPLSSAIPRILRGEIISRDSLASDSGWGGIARGRCWCRVMLIAEERNGS